MLMRADSCASIADIQILKDGLKENVGPPRPPTSQIVPAYTTGPPKLTERGSETSRWISLSMPTGTQSLFCLSA